MRKGIDLDSDAKGMKGDSWHEHNGSCYIGGISD